MDQEPDVMKREIDETRQSLTEKLETLEHQVLGTVENAKTTVEDTIASVKATVSDTVDTVKRTFDVEYQVRQHPFGCMAASLVSGFAIGYFLSGRTPSGFIPPEAPRSPEIPAALSSRMGSMESLRPDEAPASEKSAGSRLVGKFDDELHKVKGLLIGALMGFVRDLAKNSLPPAMSPHVEQIMDSATQKLGGQPLEGPVAKLSEGNGRHVACES